MVETGILTVESEQLTVTYGSLPFACVSVSMWNPYLAVFATGASAVELERAGSLIDWGPVICDHTNVIFAHIDDAEEIYMCSWGFGSDTTQVCSSRRMVSPRAMYLSG
ncbi:hypothetical protein CGC20_14025 [Leishmania donovani]|uniref:Uncharacterized protein n=1 Tax=Leishmania donovani TaxID=5661 RepID=A0A504X3E5_LEIDO|nr:hypothetical protein CGC20_14025 [Leishmania donovani]